MLRLQIIPSNDDDPGVSGETNEDEPNNVGEWHDVEGGAAPAEHVQGGDGEEAAEDSAQRVGWACNGKLKVKRENLRLNIFLNKLFPFWSWRLLGNFRDLIYSKSNKISFKIFSKISVASVTRMLEKIMYSYWQVRKLYCR